MMLTSFIFFTNAKFIFSLESNAVTVIYFLSIRLYNKHTKFLNIFRNYFPVKKKIKIKCETYFGFSLLNRIFYA